MVVRAVSSDSAHSAKCYLQSASGIIKLGDEIWKIQKVMRDFPYG